MGPRISRVVLEVNGVRVAGDPDDPESLRRAAQAVAEARAEGVGDDGGKLTPTPSGCCAAKP